MSAITRQLVAAEVAVTLYVAGIADRMREDRGQASTEYAGVLFVIVALIGIIVVAVKADTGIGTAITGKITAAINAIGS